MSAESQSKIERHSKQRIEASPVLKPSLAPSFNLYVKKVSQVRVDVESLRPGGIEALLDPDSASAILAHAGKDESFVSDIAGAVGEIRRIEKERRRGIFVILSLVNVADYTSEAFVNVCKLVYTNGIDGILVRGALTIDPFRFIRDKALGLRGRRVKILLDDVSQISEVVGAVDGVVISRDMNEASACQRLGSDLLSRQSMIWVRNMVQTDNAKADAGIASVEHEDLSTPPTTVPSSPISGSVSRSSSRSFLFRELTKFVSRSTRLIIVLSDDGMSAWELSVESRKTSTRLPPILGLSASESTCRYMGCMYGVVPMQTQSFVSVNAVVLNAVAFAKDNGLVQEGDEVVVVTQSPPVTASTNESCFEGVVQLRTV